MTEFYTAAEVAEILRQTVWRTRELLDAGDIPGAIKPAGRWLIHRETFDGWLDSLKAAS